VEVWDELKVILARLRDEQPGALMSYPTLDADEARQPPFTIGWHHGPPRPLRICTSASQTPSRSLSGPFPIPQTARRSALPNLASSPTCSTRVKMGLGWTVQPPSSRCDA
jgi:hypothetical protein